MKIKPPRVFVRLLLFGLLLGASTTAYADSLSISSLTISNLQFTPTSGTAQFTPTATTARAAVLDNFIRIIENTSNAFPVAQASANVSFASALATANATTNSLSGSTSATVGACSCTASSFAISTFTGTLVILGGEGSVDVNISALASLLRNNQTDQFGVRAESELLFDLFVNGSPVFTFQIDALSPTSGPNRFLLLQGSQQMAGVVRLQFGVENTIFARLTTGTVAVNEVPEPATVILLVSGLGFMTGVIKKRRKKADE
jgi:hypothetical protein